MYKLIFKQVCFLFLVFSLSESCLLAQNDISGTILFKEDFGGNSPSDPIAKPTGIVQCSYDYNVNPLDYTGNGRYAIRKVGYQPHWEWYAPYDHTYPDDPDRGYFFQCDASTDKCTFYYAQVDDLCENMELYLSLWSMSCTQSPDPIYAHAYLRLVVENLDGDELASKDIVVENCKGYWEQFGLSFKVPSGSTSIVYKIINNADIINGNDFCLDDIEIRLRTPLPSVSAASEPACLGEPESLNVTFVNDGSIDEPLKYTWFRSDVPSYERSDWEKIGTFSELVFPEISADDSVYYRVMVSSNGGSTDMNNCSPISDVFKLNVDDCIDSIKAFVCIDNDVEKTSQTAYNCETTDHSIVLISDEWDKHFPSKYFYRWQYSSDGGLTWSKLDESEKSFLFDKSFDGLTYFRAILANSEDILEQFEYYDGLSSDNTKKVFVTNSVSIECSICEPPIFETVNDEVVVCEDLETPISLSVKQTNSSKVDKIEWFVKNDDDDKWTLLKGESKTTLTVNNPKKNSSYLFIAHNDDCLSDSLFFNIKVNVSIILEPLQDITVCENSDVEFSANVLKGAPVSYFWNGTPSDENTYKIADIQSDDEISLSATDGVCVSSEFTVRISVEKKAEVEIEPLPTQICEGSPVKLVAHAQLSPSNTFSWKKDGILLSDSELSISDIPTSDATYLFTVQGNKCPAVEMVYDINVQKKPELVLTASATEVCENTDVTMKVSSKDAVSFEWLQKNEGENSFTTLNVTGESAVFTVQKGAEYVVRSAGSQMCPSVSSNSVFVSVEKKAEVEIEPLPTQICEGSPVKLVVHAQLSPSNTFSWKKDGILLSDSELSISDMPTSDATYLFTVQGNKCPAVEMVYDIKVQKKPELVLTASATKVCENTDVTMKVSSKDAVSFEWLQKNEGENSFTTLNVTGESAVFTVQKGAEYVVRSAGSQVCPSVSSNSVLVSVEKKAEVEIEPLPTQICEGSPVKLVAHTQLSPSNSFSWRKDGILLSDSELSISDMPTSDATYLFTVQGDKCPNVEMVYDIKVQKKPELVLTASATEVCENTDVTMKVNSKDAASFEWLQKNEGENSFTTLNVTGESAVFTVQKGAEYVVRSAGSQMCPSVSSNSVFVSVEKKAEVEIEPLPTQICEGSPVKLVAHTQLSPSNSFSWRKDGILLSDSELSISDMPTSDATYLFTVQGDKCPTVETEVVAKLEKKKIVDMVVSDSMVCSGKSVTLSSNYPYVKGVIWEYKEGNDTKFHIINNGVDMLKVTPTVTTTYRVTAISEIGCEELPTENVVKVNNSVGLQVDDISICKGISAQLVVKTEKQYDKIEWKQEDSDSIMSNLPTLIVSPQSSTSYNVYVYSGGCVEESMVKVMVMEIPRIISHEDMGNHTYQMIVNETTEPYFFDYGNGEGKTESDLLKGALYGKTYNISVFNDYGCSSNYLLEVPAIDLCFPLYFYQGEENWMVINLEKYSNTTLYVYNRYGKLLYKEQGTTIGWNGLYLGHAMPSTDYWYVVDVPEIDKQFTGHFTLMRR